MYLLAVGKLKNGHTVPAIDTLEKMARLKCQCTACFMIVKRQHHLRKMKPPKNDEWGSTGEDAVYLSKLCRLLAKMEPGDQKLLLHMAQKVAR
jgi:hypothetical protein